MDKPESWHDQDAFWELVEPFLFTMRRAELAQEQVEQIVGLLGIDEAVRILDLPCGNGRHALELASQGYRVTGVDQTQRYVEAARSEARTRDLDVQFEVGDMRYYRAPGQYDVILNLFGSFGYFDDPADDLQVVRNMADSLQMGGQFLIETAGKEIAARNLRSRDWFEEGQMLVLTERKVTHDWRRVETRYIVIRAGQQLEYTVSIRSFSAAELSSLLAAGGFADVRVYGSLAGRDYDHEAERLVVVGRKAEG